MFAIIEVGESYFSSIFGSKKPEFAIMLALWGLGLTVLPPLASFASDVLQSVF